jgi:hypothetical protein
MSDQAFEEEPPSSRTGRFSLWHRGGTRVEVSDPKPVAGGGSRAWLCIATLRGRQSDEPQDAEPTHTILIRTGRGGSPEEAQRDALVQLSLVYGTPVGPAPSTRICNKPEEDPLLLSNNGTIKRGWVERVLSLLK